MDSEYKAIAKYLLKKNDELHIEPQYTQIKVDDFYTQFRKRFSPSAMREMKKGSLYKSLFSLSNKNSMIYKLNEKKDVSDVIGHTDYQYKKHFPFYENGGVLRIGESVLNKEASKIINEASAEDITYNIIKGIVKCSEYIESSLKNGGFKTIQDYVEFGEYSVGLLGKQAGHSWFHKYLHINYPDLFSEFHAAKYREVLLENLFGIVPEKSCFGTMGQMKKIHNELCGISMYQFGQIVFLLEKDFSTVQTELNDNELKNLNSDNVNVTNRATSFLINSYDDIFPKLKLSYYASLFFELRVPWRNKCINVKYERKSYTIEAVWKDCDVYFRFCPELLDILKSRIYSSSKKLILSLSHDEREVGDIYSLDINEGAEKEEILIPEKTEDQLLQIRKLTSSELRKVAIATGSESPEKIEEETTRFKRSEYVIAYANKRAMGKCDLCNNPAPFKKKDGEPYLEVHHIIFLSENGPDTIENVVALCPNCHRRMHSLQNEEDVENLINTVEAYMNNE